MFHGRSKFTASCIYRSHIVFAQEHTTMCMSKFRYGFIGTILKFPIAAPVCDVGYAPDQTRQRKPRWSHELCVDQGFPRLGSSRGCYCACTRMLAGITASDKTNFIDRQLITRRRGFKSNFLKLKLVYAGFMLT